MATTLTTHPFAGAHIAIIAKSLIGDTKGEWYTDSVTAAMNVALAKAMTPDTVINLCDTNAQGEATVATTIITYNQVSGRHEYHSLIA